MNFLQEIFDIGARHLSTQNKKSVVGRTQCAYKGDNGLKCAAAPFIHSYDEEYEGFIVPALEHQFSVFSDCGYSGEELKFIRKLQEIHDLFFVDKWYTKLLQLAEKHNLSTKVLKCFTK